MDDRQHIVVVGGGITGLTAAYHIVERTAGHVHVTLLEPREDVGGSIVTHERDGFLIEAGPDSFITQKPRGLALCQRLGIDDQLIPTNSTCRRTFVVRGGRLYPIPEGFLLLAPTRLWPFVFSRLFSWPGKLRMGMDLVLPRGGPDAAGDESLGDFVRRRFGREALARIAQPLVGGIYTADPDKLSLRSTMPRFLEMEHRYRSVIWAMRRGRKTMARQGEGPRGFASVDSGARYSMFVSFQQGMATLLDALRHRLSAQTIRTGVSVRSLVPQGQRWQVGLSDGADLDADAVILACPSYVSAELVRGIDADLAGRLSTLAYASSATMSLAFRREQINHGLDGFGFVVPFVERRSTIAVTFNSVKFEGRAPAGWVLMRAFLGGAMQPAVYERDDADLRRAVLADLRELIGVQGEPAFVELYRWPRSMPQYPVGHQAWCTAIRQHLAQRWPTLAVAGNAFGGVGIPDCIHSAETAVEQLLGAVVDHS